MGTYERQYRLCEGFSAWSFVSGSGNGTNKDFLLGDNLTGRNQSGNGIRRRMGRVTVNHRSGVWNRFVNLQMQENLARVSARTHNPVIVEIYEGDIGRS